MGQLYILDLTKRGVDIDKAARGKGRDRISAHTVRSWNALPGQDHPKDAKGRWTSGHPSVGLMGDLPDVVGRLSDDDLKRADQHANSLIAALTAEKGRRGVAAMAAAQKAKPLKATKPKAAVKAIDSALTAKIAEIRKRPLPGDREFLEGVLGKLTIAQIQSLDENPLPAGSKASKVEEMVRRLTRQLASEAVTHQGSAKGRDYDADYRRRLADAAERGDREGYAALVAGFGVGGTGPGLPEKKPHRFETLRDPKMLGPSPEATRLREQEAAERKLESAAAKPLKATKPAAKANDGSALTSSWMSGTFAADIDAVIKNPKAGSAELLTAQLERLKVSELGELAKKYDVKLLGRTKKEKIAGFVASTVQNKLNSQAIRDQTNFAPKPKAKPGTANLERLAGGSLSDFAGPRYLDTPRRVQGSGNFFEGHFHPDGRMGTAWQGLSARQASEDIDGMRLDDALAEAIRMGYDGQPGRIGEQMTRFQEIISKVRDPKVKADLQYAFDRLKPQARHDLTAKELADAPEPLRKLMSQLGTIPDTGQGGGEVTHLANILRRWSAGEIRAGRLDMEIDRLASFRHESQEGHHEVSRAVRKAVDEIRAMRRDLRQPGS